MPTEIFKVSIYGISAKDFHIKNPKVILHFNFDHFKTFKLPAVRGDNPHWDYQILFYYETVYIHHLAAKTLEIRAFHKKLFGGRRFLGVAKVDLHTIATGSAVQDIPLHRHKKSSKPTARVKFVCEMEHYREICISFPKFFASNLKTDKVATEHELVPYAEVSFNIPGVPEIKPHRTGGIKGTINPIWLDTPTIYFKATLKELLSGVMQIRVKHEKTLQHDPLIGYDLSHFCSIKEHEFKFNKALHLEDDIAGQMSGIIVIKNVPMYGQLIGGVNTEHGIKKGQPLVLGVPLPKVELTEFIWTPFAPRKQTVTPLPKGWEEKVDQKGRVFYVDHAKKETTWRHPREPITAEEAAKKIQEHWKKRSGKKIKRKSKDPKRNSKEVQKETKENHKDHHHHHKDKDKDKDHNHRVATPTPPTKDIHVHVEDDAKVRLSITIPSNPVPPSPVIMLDAKGRLLPTLDIRDRASSAPSRETSPMSSPASARKHQSVSNPLQPIPELRAPASPRGNPVVANLAILNEGLPPGWEARIDAAGRPYFVDHTTKQTSWTKPTPTISPVFSNQPFSTVSPSPHSAPHIDILEPVIDMHHSNGHHNDHMGKPLPTGWEQRTNEQGRTYFVNHQLKTTQWVDPRLT